MRKKKTPDKVDLSEDQLEDLKKKIVQNKLSTEEKDLVIKALQGMLWLSKMLEAKKLSIRKLARLFGFKTEKSSNLKGDDKDKNKGGKDKSERKNKPKPKGHGRNGHEDFDGAKRIWHQHEDLEKGMRCPSCDRGNLYDIDPGVFIHIRGATPLTAEVHLAQKLRCSTCGDIFTANVPKEVRKQKFDETADVAIGLLKYGWGLPFNRLSKWQRYLGVPLAASTQWERAEYLTSSVYPVYSAFIKMAAMGSTCFADDTGSKIIKLKKELIETKSKRTGIYTTGIVSKFKDKTINLFFTDNRHAGENVDRVLAHRPNDLGPIILMTDALSRNCPKEAFTIWCNCLVHGRRNFVDLHEKLPGEIGHVLYCIGKIYLNEKKIKKLNLNDKERMSYHQKKSERWLTKLRRWGPKKVAMNKIEANSPLGEAFEYLFNHWEELTQFLRIPGAPLDNSICERLLKTAIIHRKNSLFFRTKLGAYVADVLMSLIQTCISAGKNPFEYLLALHRNKSLVHKNPDKFLPWNFEETLALT